MMKGILKAGAFFVYFLLRSISCVEGFQTANELLYSTCLLNELRRKKRE